MFILKNLTCKGLVCIGGVDLYASTRSLSLTGFALPTARPVPPIGVVCVLKTFYKYKSMLYA